jgi:sec-independent protein translocase protein TatA
MSASTPVLAILNLGPFEIVLIFFVILLLFGAKRLPELARGMGKAIAEFKKASAEAEHSIRDAIEEPPKTNPPPKPPPASPPSNN